MFLVLGKYKDIRAAAQANNKDGKGELEWKELPPEVQEKIKKVLSKEEQRELGL